MVFGGIQKLTLLDYPGKIACTLFTKGCNFYCPFCHNAGLVNFNDDSIDEEEILSYLKKRKGMLEGVCVSGGEPLIHKETDDFIKKVKALGYSVKLDTNGSFPDRLKVLAAEGLIDYVAMDVKNSFEKYHLTAGRENLDLAKIEESMDFLLEGSIDYEFRTTVVAELHTTQDIVEIAKRISGAKIFSAKFYEFGNILGENLHPADEKKLENMLFEARKYVQTALIREKADSTIFRN